MADTPALPGATPDPSATPRLDALLREVETQEARERHLWDVFYNKAFPFRQSDAARLAAIVRVLVEALPEVLRVIPDIPQYPAMGFSAISILKHALARAEAIAKGES